MINTCLVYQYHVGQLYSVAEMSKQETGGGDGVEVISNQPFTGQPLYDGGPSCGQYTYKIFHLRKKVPSFIRLLAPENSTQLHEKSWNAYPYSRTIYSNPYMKENFHLSIETIHAADKGDTENIHKLSPQEWSEVEVVKIDIANDPVSPDDYKSDEDPTKVASKKTGRGPLVGPRWWEKMDPVMTCYKLIKCEFKWFGLQTKVEKVVQDFERRLMIKFHRQVFCWLDQWHGLSIDSIRAIEENTQKELDQQRHTGQIRGTVG
ncbi:hypothetical protein Pcinc_022791 [Petrolisthes cinctipes]|uniref:Phosphatidylinositol transfer protein N-terminal domain-containing protein n=1 Tax=Petrolisthes cinctipes TaxID=88211 RepID=A0AAE1KFC7_PETCI|nr:hypothetical protein Pcinc_022791 [Petrolisthes cinctipes]